MNKKIIIIALAFVVVAFAVFFPFVSIFHGRFLSDHSLWSSLGCYSNGVLTPLLQLASIVVLLKVNNSLSQMHENTTRRNIEAIKRRNKDELSDFRVRINSKDDADDLFKSIEENLEAIENAVDTKGNMSWEVSHLAVPNGMTRIRLHLKQLEVLILDDKCKMRPNDETLEKRYVKTLSELEELHRKSMLAD